VHGLVAYDLHERFSAIRRAPVDDERLFHSQARPTLDASFVLMSSRYWSEFDRTLMIIDDARMEDPAK
jgi:hypothetical protein